MLQQELLKRESQNKPIKVGASGAGWMGGGFVTQVTHVPGMTVNVLACLLYTSPSPRDRS